MKSHQLTQQSVFKVIQRNPDLIDLILRQGGFVWAWDVDDLENKWISEGFWEVLGFSAVRDRSALWEEILYQPDYDKTLRNLQSYLAGQSDTFEQTIRVRSAQGNFLCFRNVGRLVEADGGTGRLIIGTNSYVDLTLSRLHHAVKSKGELLFVLDSDVRIVDAFFHDKSDLVMSPVEFLGRKLDELPLPQQAVAAIREAHENSLKSTQSIPLIYSLPFDSGDQVFAGQATSLINPHTAEKEVLFVIKNETTTYREKQELQDQRTYLEFLFNNPFYGAFLMMIDKPIEWSDHVNKRKILDYVFQHQEVTRINQAMLDQYGATEADFIGFKPLDFFPHDHEQAYDVWTRLFDQGQLKIETYEKSIDGRDLIIEGNYICIYNQQKQILGHFGVQRDITESRKHEVELEAKNTLIKKITDSVPGAVFKMEVTLDGSFILHEVNSYFEDFFHGLKTGTVFDTEEGKYHVIDPRDKSRVAESIEQALNSLLPWKCEFRVSQKGQEVWIQGEAAVEREENGSTILYGVLLDITDKKKYQIELEQSIGQFEFISSNTTDGIMLFEGGRIVYASDSYLKILGYTIEEEKARTEEDIYGLVHPEDRPSVIKKIQEAASNRDPQVVYEYRALRKDSRYIWREDQVNLIYNEAGQITKSVLIARDISFRRQAEQELRESEEKFRLLIENLQVGVIVHGPNTEILLFNEKALDLLGLSADQLQGRSSFDPVWNVVREDGSDFPPEEHPSSVAIDTKQTVRNIIMGVFNPLKNQRTWLQVDAVPRISNDGNLEQAVVTFTDVTEKINAQKQLRQALKDAKAASIAKSEFLANMTHELRTPLNGIVGFSDLLRDATVPAPYDQHIEFISQSASNLKFIIQDILDFSKIEAGKLEINISEINVEEICRQIAAQYQLLCDQKGLAFDLVIESQFATGLQGDDLRLKQILNNLLSNALKFTEQGKISLMAEQVSEDSEMQRIRFSVKDTGIGVSSENQRKIFEEFTQADSSTTKKYGGTGLGLSISKRLLQLMGSSLELDSVPGNGSTFSFEIEFNKGAKPPKSVVPEPEQKFERFGPLSILIVDDNKINQILTEALVNDLVKSDSIIKSVDNGFKAVDACTENQYDLIFLDLQMPGINGYETFEKLNDQKLVENSVVIALTAAAMTNEAEKCREVGMDDFISKPITREDIAACLRAHFTKSIPHKDMVHFDEAAFRASFSVDAETLDEIKTETKNYLEATYETLISMEDQPSEDFRAFIHKLKGTALNMRMQHLSELSQSCESHYKRSGMIDTVLLQKIRREVEHLLHNEFR